MPDLLKKKGYNTTARAPICGAALSFRLDARTDRQGVKKFSVLTFDTGFRRFPVQWFVPRQCLRDFGGVEGQQRCEGQPNCLTRALANHSHDKMASSLGINFGRSRSMTCHNSSSSIWS